MVQHSLLNIWQLISCSTFGYLGNRNCIRSWIWSHMRYTPRFSLEGLRGSGTGSVKPNYFMTLLSILIHLVWISHASPSFICTMFLVRVLELGSEYKHYRRQRRVIIMVLLCSGGYIWFKTSIPPSLLFEGTHTVQSHFDLVNYQVSYDIPLLSLTWLCKQFRIPTFLILSVLFYELELTKHTICLLQLIQIRTALAVASALNRTLVSWGVLTQLIFLKLRHIVKSFSTDQSTGWCNFLEIWPI